MDHTRIKDLLGRWSRKLTGSVRPGLSQEIKQRIPDRLTPHGFGMISIIVDLRASRMAIAASILIGLAVLAGGIAGRDGGIFQMYRDGKLLAKYALTGEDAYRGEALSSLMTLRDSLVSQGHSVTYYGDRANPKDGMAVLMHWRVDDAKDPNNVKYGVIMADFSAQTVSPAMLIQLQARMLQRSGK
jgi:hypothetical protein